MGCRDGCFLCVLCFVFVSAASHTRQYTHKAAHQRVSAKTPRTICVGRASVQLELRASRKRESVAPRGRPPSRFDVRPLKQTAEAVRQSHGCLSALVRRGGAESRRTNAEVAESGGEAASVCRTACPQPPPIGDAQEVPARGDAQAVIAREVA